VHNSFLAVAAELGFLGLALYILILLTTLVSCQRLCNIAGTEPTVLAIGQSATALRTSLLAFLVGGFFVIFQYQEMLWHYFGLSIALSNLGRQIPSSTFPSAASEGLSSLSSGFNCDSPTKLKATGLQG
jgi:hypothetical protein